MFREKAFCAAPGVSVGPHWLLASRRGQITGKPPTIHQLARSDLLRTQPPNDGREPVCPAHHGARPGVSGGPARHRRKSSARAAQL